MSSCGRPILPNLRSYRAMAALGETEVGKTLTLEGEDKQIRPCLQVEVMAEYPRH